MASLQHDALVALGAKWLKKQGISVIGTEITAIGSREQADAIGFFSSSSVLVEAKVSRADFLADSKKPERLIEGLGLGIYRFYLCPEGLIQPEDAPARWGLLYERNGKVVEVLRPQGNIWPGYGTNLEDWAAFQHKPNERAERSVLFSIARRLAQRK